VGAKTNTAPPKGTRDFLPDDVHKREHVTRVIRDVYQAHGFSPLETPTFERLDTLLGKYGEEGDQLVFKILHRGEPLVKGVREAYAHLEKPGVLIKGRSGEIAPSAEKLLSDMGLRYDLTVPLARVYAEYQGKLPAVLKRYQIQPVWRADTPGKGRFREFYQCDVDVCGSSELIVEAEVLGAVSECMERLGFADFEIRINHRALLKAMIEIAGIEPAKETAAIVAIDKLDKVGPEGVLKELADKGVGEGSRQKLAESVLADPSGAALEMSLATHERGQAALKEVRAVIDLARRTPARSHLVFNTTLARGLGYYTGCIFELQVKDLDGSLGGGGRYDGLIGMFLGKDVPACGFSLGLERILVVMEERKMFPALRGGVEAIVAAADEGSMARALEIAYAIRRSGAKAELLSKVEKPGKARKNADDRGVPYAVIVRAEDATAVNLWSRSDPEKIDRMVSALDLGDLIRAK
jgi:histidyl-tRNA synthetase